MEEFLENVCNYFSTEEWQDLSVASQKEYAKHYYIYFSCIDLGIDVVVPDFMDPTKTIEKTFACQFCKVIYFTESNKDVHEQTCSERTAIVDKSLEHSALYHYLSAANLTNKKFKCDKCDYESWYKKSVTRHKQMHTQPNKFKCNFCEYETTWKDNLKQHQLQHGAEKPFRCDQCVFSCYWKSSLKAHKEIHHENVTYKCPECPYKCVSKHNFKGHMFKHTGGNLPHKCTKCNFQCTLKSTLTNHLNTHLKDKPFKCDKCPYQCSQKVSLKNHMYKHFGSQITCDECGQQFSCNYNLTRHKKRLHSDK